MSDYIKEEKNLALALKEALSKITLKKVTTGIGHDLGGYFCDFYLKGHGKIGYINDDGWGGDVTPTYVSKAKQKVFEDFLKANNVAQKMLDNGFSFYKSAEKINFDTQAITIIEVVLIKLEEEKFIKKQRKQFEKAIVFGNDNSYTAVKFKIPLKAVVLSKKGKEILQNEYDKIKRNLKENEKILNDNLQELGITL